MDSLARYRLPNQPGREQDNRYEDPAPVKEPDIAEPEVDPDRIPDTAPIPEPDSDPCERPGTSCPVRRGQQVAVGRM